MGSELKDCPFCGAAAELDTQRGYSQYPSGKPGSAVAIYCTGCSADMTLCREDMRDHTTEDLAFILTEMWNRRALSALKQREGWVAVPAEPTELQKRSIFNVLMGESPPASLDEPFWWGTSDQVEHVADIYKAMLSAAPKSDERK